MRRRPCLRLRLGFAASAAIGLLAIAPLAVGDEAAFTIAEPHLTAVTGVARDTGHNLYWFVQPEAAQTTTVYGLDATGATQARLSFAAASPQAAAVAWYGESLFIADIGDPSLDRATVTVYGVPARDVAGDHESVFSAWELTYPDGPHDAAALLLTATGEFVIVTTGPDPAFYRAPGDPSLEEPTVLERLSDAPAGVTDGLFLSDQLVALRTTTTVQVLDAATWAVVAEDPIETVGQGLALSLDGTALIVTGEGLDVATVPVPSTLPDPGESSAAAPSGDSAAMDISRSGTFIMIGAAAILALSAAVLAFLRR